jgi:predicted aspartyl protease
MRPPLIGLAVLTALAAIQPVRAEVAPTPFRLQPPGDIVVPVTIDGQGPFRMLLDTGAGRSAISAKVAARLASRGLGETTLLTPAGQARRRLVLIKGLAFGGRGPGSIVGVALEPGDLSDSAIDGLIGQDVLSSRVFTIDYARSRIVWHSDGDGKRVAGTRLPVDVLNGRVLVSLPQQAPAGEPPVVRALRLIPDSGADRLVLFTPSANALPPLVPVERGLLLTPTGTRPVHRVLIDELAVGDIRLRHQDAALVERPEGGAVLGDGLLPLHLFSRVTMNVPAGYLIVHR